jgi:hypothetical protein
MESEDSLALVGEAPDALLKDKDGYNKKNCCIDGLAPWLYTACRLNAADADHRVSIRRN